jgi:hypothetical protein
MEQEFQTRECSQGGLGIPEAHPVFGVIVGSTLAELPLILKAQSEVRSDQVPNRLVVIDSLPYEDLRTRMIQGGWTPEQFEQALPRSSFFHLTSPFTETFDFDNPMNRSYAEMTSDPGVRRAAKHPDAPGCAGIPVLARARVESNSQELRDFLESHLQELTRVRRETLALRPGVLCFVLTTYRGATGSGASARVAAILRSVMNGGEVHLRAMMPCIYRGDNRAHANAFAAMVENQHFHRFKGGVPTKDGKLLPSPFDSVVYVFGSNRKQALGQTDGLMQLCSVMTAYTRVATQSSILARRVDLADVMPFDHEDRPTHVSQEASLSVCAIPPGVNEYIVTRWVELELADKLARFNEWCQTEALSAGEEVLTRKLAERVVDELNLSRDHLLTRLDLSPSPMNTLRAFMERVKGAVGTMKSGVIKSNIKMLPGQVQERFARFEACWSERAIELARSLPTEVLESVRAKTQAAPYIELSVLTRLREHLLSVASDAKSEAEKEKARRASAGGQLGSALNAVQEARRGMLGFIREDEVTRDAADKACDIALTASLARAQQERNEYLVQALADGLSVADAKGSLASVPSVTLALVHTKTERVAAIRQLYQIHRDQLGDRLNACGHRVQKRSPVFQRTLMFDGIRLEELDDMARAIRKSHQEVPGILGYLEGRQDLSKTLSDLLPLLPSFSDAGRSLAQILQADPAKRNQVVQLLRSCVPFTPIDREIEEQQHLRNRLDNLAILEVPGGADSQLAELFLREGVVPSRNHIVDSGEEEIRLYVLRQGLPYAALEPVERYRDRYEQYLANPGSVTPYTVPDPHKLLGIHPPRTNLADYTLRLLYLSKAVQAANLKVKPSGGFSLRYENETTSGFTVSTDQEFPDFATMKAWLAKHVNVRRSLAAELNRQLDADPSDYKARLLAVWNDSSGEEKHFVQEELFRLRVDPSNAATAAGA